MRYSPRESCTRARRRTDNLRHASSATTLMHLHGNHVPVRSLKLSAHEKPHGDQTERAIPATGDCLTYFGAPFVERPLY